MLYRDKALLEMILLKMEGCSCS